MKDEMQSRLEAETGNAFDGQPKVYIGDGVYVFSDGFSLYLATCREDVIHWMAIEPRMLRELVRFADEIKTLNA